MDMIYRFIRLVLLSFLAVPMLSGCLLHLGDTETRRTTEATVDLDLSPGESSVVRFQAGADRHLASRLIEFGAGAALSAADSGTDVRIVLRDVATGEELEVTGHRRHFNVENTLPLECGDAGCTHLVEADITRVDTVPGDSTARLRLWSTSRFECCGDAPGDPTLHLTE